MNRILSLAFFLLLLTIRQGAAQRYNDILITEIMADPSPAVGLPEVEYIELYNRTDKQISFKNWHLNLGSKKIPMPDSVLGGHEHVVISQKNNAVKFQGLAKSWGVNGFSLVNENGLIAIYNSRNQLVCATDYKAGWWAPEKRDGGYALEMADIEAPCTGRKNWDVSSDAHGGTPGRKNSLSRPVSDKIAPWPERVDLNSARELLVYFNETIDSASAVNTINFSIQGRDVLDAEVEMPLFRQLKLTLHDALADNQRYTLTIKNISDCAGNILRQAVMDIALPIGADSGDVVLNEILFNPRDNGVDFVEVYNRSAKYISLKDWSLGNIKKGNPDAFESLTAQNFVMPPGSFLALSADSDVVREQYPVEVTRSFLEMERFPVYANTTGGVVLRDAQQRIADRFDYAESMHSVLLNSVEGVSLEKADASKSSQESGNWRSGSGVTGYATPGYRNSQVYAMNEEEFVRFQQSGVSPNGDGQDDQAVFDYQFSGAGNFCNMKIFDIQGRLVKSLLQNQSVAASGQVVWDATDNKNTVVAPGYYLLLTDVWNASGSTRKFRNRVVVAR
ncbi:hypothetical protein DYBT9275_00761 [Dyadobacter sp. CECT 9275]|uniref:LTD domain-containing protein n=1 Tax=Dyadobacter helix TaxID=2822344 RepID=A0A916JAP4_9BACT|nr:lamin tail domain-containing protein [Dyadobacter sp. CECT 9275]CAG4991473.1 hypothetical protein DYBT9275_00761 [Dyadobacter sp. CECT 9275]